MAKHKHKGRNKDKMPGLFLIRIFIFSPVVFFSRVVLFFPAVIFFLGLGGCSNTQEPIVPEYVIKTGSTIISKEEFMRELDLKMAAYPYDFKKNSLEYNETVLDLVSILSEETVLLSAAQDKGILVSGPELDAGEAFYREDYPEDSFDKILLENAISYVFWKKKLEKNLIVDKLIQQELTDKVEIKPEDIVAFYKRHVSQVEDKDSSGIAMDENKLVSQLRRAKSQEAYDEWIMELKNQYPVEINKNILTSFLIDMENSKGSIND
jgi:hypothetical protein